MMILRPKPYKFNRISVSDSPAAIQKKGEIQDAGSQNWISLSQEMTKMDTHAVFQENPQIKRRDFEAKRATSIFSMLPFFSKSKIVPAKDVTKPSFP